MASEDDILEAPPTSVTVRIPKEIHQNIQIRAALGSMSFNEIVAKALERDCARYPELIKQVQKLASEIRQGESE